MAFAYEKRLGEIEDRIIGVCEKSNRTREDVTLIAVSKTHPMEKIMGYYELGIRDFGESKVQELSEKMQVLPKDIKWHMIGHLQRNKIKYIIDRVYLIHSVDSIRLAEAISKEALKCGREVQILLEVNVAEEESKFGFHREEVLPAVKVISEFPGIRIKGLMTIAPYVENAEDNRHIFEILREMAVDINRQNIDNVDMNVLSMGMTGDYDVAIEEGATFVRVGTGLFGKRDYSKSEQNK